MRRALRRLRGKKTTREFAQELGVTAATVNRWEKGTRTPPMEVAHEIARRYGKRPEALWQNEPEDNLQASPQPAS